MKKWLIGLVVIVLALVVFIYLWIPNTIQIHRSTGIAFKRTGIERIIFDENNWGKWWPGTSNEREGLIFNGNKYKFKEKKLSTIEITIENSNGVIPSSLNVFFANKDSAILEWNASISTSLNPFKRINQYHESKSLKNDFQEILNRIRNHFADSRNIYGTLIREVLVEDSVLAFTEQTTNGYPSTGFIYGMITELKKDLKQKGVKEAGFPMLNISTPDNHSYLVKIAIPVDKELEPYHQIRFKRMVKRGNILVTEVTGGPFKLEQAFKQVELYMSDHERLAPAIPYYSLITDRMFEPDTSKWVTKIYYPVM